MTVFLSNVSFTATPETPHRSPVAPDSWGAIVDRASLAVSKAPSKGQYYAPLRCGSRV